MLVEKRTSCLATHHADTKAAGTALGSSRSHKSPGPNKWKTPGRFHAEQRHTLQAGQNNILAGEPAFTTPCRSVRSLLVNRRNVYCSDRSRSSFKRQKLGVEQTNRVGIKQQTPQQLYLPNTLCCKNRCGNAECGYLRYHGHLATWAILAILMASLEIAAEYARAIGDTALSMIATKLTARSSLGDVTFITLQRQENHAHFPSETTET